MKVPYFAGQTLAEFVKSAEVVKTDERDGVELKVYGMAVAAIEGCPQENCGSERRLRRNGSYMRQVIEGLRLLMVLIYRFRCGLCGKTVSRPYSFLVPYRRFTAKLICRGIEQYGGADETSYSEISADLSVFAAETNSEATTASAEKAAGGKEGFCPARSTAFSWVDFVCKRIVRTEQQLEKELVLGNFDMNGLPGERQFRNKNAWKAGKERDKHQRDKPEELNKLSYGLGLGRTLVGGGEDSMEKVRAYFFESAEKCADILSDVLMVLPITHTSEQRLW